MLEFILGAGVGVVGGVVIKDKISPKQELETNGSSLSHDEVDELKRRNRELEEQVDELLNMMEQRRKLELEMDDEQSDLEDELKTAKIRVQTLLAENERLNRDVQELEAIKLYYEQKTTKE